MAHLVTVGDELLAGDVVDSNKARMAACARAIGLDVRRAITVRDRLRDIIGVLHDAAVEADVCLVSGGLGPTVDDLTASAVAKAAGHKLVRDDAARERLEEKFRRIGRPMADINLKQVDFPEGAELLDNPIGTAEGFCVELPGRRACQVFVMPGVPRELERMLEEEVVPRVRRRFAPTPVPRRIYRSIGIGESSVAKRIEPVIEEARGRSPGLNAMFVHYRASTPEVSVILEALRGPNGEQATPEELESLDESMLKALAPGIYGIGQPYIAERLVPALVVAGLRVATAESCTGGGVGALITKVPGSSAAFRGGIISYDNQMKKQLLGVPSGLLVTHGAVSEPVARAMARGVRDRLGADLAVAVTGIAGPGGGTPEKPVGTVHIAVVDGFETFHKALLLHGDRAGIQRSSALWALKLLWDRLVLRGAASISAREA
ncbi:MAG: CinA family nicotinamide mononucleotide deamidase-related protein [Myxococcales bacterium]|nr:CinA family nicotinamide mononucleotide deamidase-related protein [Myxococcales bacterium]